MNLNLNKKTALLIFSILLFVILLVGCVPSGTNQMPIITSIPLTSTTINQTYIYNVTATDPDVEDTLSFSLITNPAGMTINSTTGLINWTPTATGDYYVMVEVSDNGSPVKSITQSFTIHVKLEVLEPIIPETTIVIDEQAEQEIYSITVDQSTIVFRGDSPQLEDIALGDIIAMGVTEHTPEGLLRKVTNITKGGKDSSKVVIETEFATLEEAIEQGEFYFNEALKAEDAKEPVFYVKGVEFIRDKSTIRDSKIQLLEFTYNINAIIYDEDNNPNTEEDNIALIGQISFDYNLLFSGKIAFFHKLKELNFQNIVEIEKSLGVTVGGSVELFSYEKVLWTHSLGTKLVWVGYLPIVLSPKISISANVNGEIFAKVTAEITDKDIYTAGIKFDNGSWQPISSHESYSSPPSLSLSTGGAVTFGVGPKLECKVDGVLGPYCETSLYGKVIADIYTNPWWKIYVGIIAKAGVKIEIFSKVLASASFTILDLKKIIAQADGPFNVNHAPVITSTAVTSATKNQPYSYNVDATDSDGDTLTYSLTTKPSGMSINSSNGLINWTPSNTGSYNVTVKVSDGELSDTQSFTITVSDDNHSPVITSTPVTSATKNQPYSYNVDATDSDGDTLTYSLTTKPSGMSINSSNGLINWTPSNTGSYNVTVKVSDGELSDTQSFTITVSDDNHSPVITSTPVTSATKDEPYSYNVDATDSDGDTLTYSLTTKPSGMSINSSNGLINWTPSNTGSYNVTVKVSDGELSDTQSFTITVSDSNHAPVITSTAVTSATKNQPYSYNVDATDSDGDTLTYSLTTKPSGMSINSSNGLINWTPSNTGSYNVTVKVSDGELSDTQSFTITVSDDNHSPVITSTPVTSATKNQPYSYNVDATDSDGDTLTYSLTTKPSGMSINSSNGLINWTPSNTGSYNVTVKVSDGELSDTQSFTITVSDDNHSPVITSTPVTSATKDEPYSYNVDATDSDGDTLTYSLTTKPSGMSINSSNGLINWTPSNTGSYNVTVKVSDGELSASQSFTITVGMEGDYVVEFEDPNLEQAVRETINKPEGPLYLSDVIGIIYLKSEGRGINSLEGIQHLQNLKYLYFINNQVSDISVLSNLTNLQQLSFSGNQVSDISAVSNLTNLESLRFENNQVSAISAVSNLTNLEVLAFRNNQVTGISAVSNLTNLRRLSFTGNQVSDISVLSNLTNLEGLWFFGNQVTDISALVSNEGFGSGDFINMCYNYLDLTEGSQDMQNIETLISRGVDVMYEPQCTP